MHRAYCDMESERAIMDRRDEDAEDLVSAERAVIEIVAVR